MCIGMEFALSYNMLLGQSGILPFGHAVYSGLGAYSALHALNLVRKGQIGFPVTLLPLIGRLPGMLFAVALGYVTTRRSGTTFAMISLGIGEMIAACSLMLPGFFGGEGGVTANRVVGQPFLGISYGPAIQVYYLIAAWTFVCTVAMFAFTHTPLGRIASAVRDNPERAGFIGYNPQRLRWLVMIRRILRRRRWRTVLHQLRDRLAENGLGARRVLIATYIGGAGFFFGPISRSSLPPCDGGGNADQGLVVLQGCCSWSWLLQAPGGSRA